MKLLTILILLIFSISCQSQTRTAFSYNWQINDGTLIINFAKFIIEILHLHLRQENIYKEGFNFGLRIRNKEEFQHNGRDSNPYERGTYDYTKWDCGYIPGLGGFSFIDN